MASTHVEERLVQVRELPCDTCGTEMLFEVPPCVDGHGDDCPELVCTGCGSALLMLTAPTVTLAAARPPRRRPHTPQAGRAA